jgi:hypothetical protein
VATFVNAVMNVGFHKKTGNLLLSELTVVSSIRALLRAHSC